MSILDKFNIKIFYKILLIIGIPILLAYIFGLFLTNSVADKETINSRIIYCLKNSLNDTVYLSFKDLKKYDYHYINPTSILSFTSKDTFLNHQRYVILAPQKVLYLKDSSINNLELEQFINLKINFINVKIQLMSLYKNRIINLNFDNSKNTTSIIDTFYRYLFLINNINENEISK